MIVIFSRSDKQNYMNFEFKYTSTKTKHKTKQNKKTQQSSVGREGRRNGRLGLVDLVKREIAAAHGARVRVPKMHWMIATRRHEATRRLRDRCHTTATNKHTRFRTGSAEDISGYHAKSLTFSPSRHCNATGHEAGCAVVVAALSLASIDLALVVA